MPILFFNKYYFTRIDIILNIVEEEKMKMTMNNKLALNIFNIFVYTYYI